MKKLFILFLLLGLSLNVYAQVTYRSSGTIVANGNAGVDMSANLPSGLAIDDIMIFVGMDADNEHFDAGMPDGWTVITSNNATGNMGYTVAWKRYDGTETDWQFDTPSVAGSLVCGIIHAYQNCIKTGTPYLNLTFAGVTNNTGIGLNFQGVSTLFTCAFHIIEDDVNVTNNSAGAWTVRDNQTTTVGSDGRLILNTKSDTSFNLTQFITGSNEYNALIIINLIPDTNRPTIIPNTADAHDFGADDTPTLEFTGSDANDDDLEYEFEILSAIDTDVDKYVESNQNSSADIPFAAPTHLARGQSFTGNGDYLTEAKFHISKTISSTGIAYVKLYAHSGTFGTSSIPTGNPLAVSQSFDISTLTTSLAITSFLFNGTYQMVNTTKYVIVIEFHPNNGDQIRVGLDNSSPTHSGNASTLDGTWSSLSYDLIFYVLGSTRELNKLSVTPDATFTNTTDGADAHPFDQPDLIDYTVQAGDALADGTWFWRARAIDPIGTNQWSDWTAIRSFDIDTGGAPPRRRIFIIN